MTPEEYGVMWIYHNIPRDRKYGGIKMFLYYVYKIKI